MKGTARLDCPLCHQAMEHGVITSRAPGAKFSSGDGWDVALGDLTGDSLGSGLLSPRHRSALFVLWHCRDSRVVVVPASESDCAGDSRSTRRHASLFGWGSSDGIGPVQRHSASVDGPLTVRARIPLRVKASIGPLNDAQQQSTAWDAKIDRQGFGLWAVERAEDGALRGLAGLNPVPPGIITGEGLGIGWRLARHAWGNGYATEAAEPP